MPRVKSARSTVKSPRRTSRVRRESVDPYTKLAKSPPALALTLASPARAKVRKPGSTKRPSGPSAAEVSLHKALSCWRDKLVWRGGRLPTVTFPWHKSLNPASLVKSPAKAGGELEHGLDLVVEEYENILKRLVKCGLSVDKVASVPVYTLAGEFYGSDAEVRRAGAMWLEIATVAFTFSEVIEDSCGDADQVQVAQRVIDMFRAAAKAGEPPAPGSFPSATAPPAYLQDYCRRMYAAVGAKTFPRFCVGIAEMFEGAMSDEAEFDVTEAAFMAWRTNDVGGNAFWESLFPVAGVDLSIGGEFSDLAGSTDLFHMYEKIRVRFIWLLGAINDAVSHWKEFLKGRYRNLVYLVLRENPKFTLDQAFDCLCERINKEARLLLRDMELAKETCTSGSPAVDEDVFKFFEAVKGGLNSWLLYHIQSHPRYGTPAGAPKHVALIPDGHRRYGREMDLTKEQAHRHGFINVAPRLIDTMYSAGVEVVTLWLFAEANWNRSEEECTYLMDLYVEFVEETVMGLAEKWGCQVHHIGRRDRIPEATRDAVDRVVAATSDPARKRAFIVALDYCGQGEISRASAKVAAKGEEITPESITQHLDTAPLGDAGMVDLVVRSSGTVRISNFMLWQAANAEWVFLEPHLPAVRDIDICRAISQFKARERRFGK